MKEAPRTPEVDLREVVDTDIGPYHILLAVLINHYATFIHDPSISDSSFSTLPEYEHGEVKFTGLLLRLLRGNGQIWQPSMSDLLHSINATMDDFARSIRGDLMQFLGEMNYPEDLLTYNTKYLEAMTRDQTDEDLSGPLLDPCTELGQFVRQVSLAIRALPFEALCLLFSDLQLYGSLYVSPRKSPLGRSSSLQEWTPQRERQVALETIIDTRLEAIGRQGCGVLSLEELDKISSELVAVAEDIPRVHLLRHMVALRQNDQPGAVEALHRYFDYWEAPPPPDEGDYNNSYFPEALLNLGATHAHFGQTKQAMLALNETVRVAQQLSDDLCLQHALAQLCRVLISTTPTAARAAGYDELGSDYFVQLQQLLLRCLKRSRELELPHLEAYARLAIAQFRWLHYMRPTEAMQEDLRDRPFSGLEDVQAAVTDLSMLHHSAKVASATPKPADARHQYSQNAAIPNVPDLYPSQKPVFNVGMAGYEESSAATVEQIAGASYLMQAAAYAQAGDRVVADSCSQIYLDSFAATGRIEDCCLAYAQLATSAAESEGYEAAEQILAIVDRRYPHVNDQRLAAARLAIAHDKAQRRGDFAKAEQLAQDLISTSGSTASLNADIRVEGVRRLAETLMRKGCFHEAEAKIRLLFAECQEAGMQGQAARLLLTLGELHRDCMAPAAAVPYALACQKHARELGYNLLAAEAQILLAELYFDLRTKSREECFGMVLHVMPLVLGNGSCSLQAQLHRTLALLYLKSAQREDIAKNAERIVDHLEAATALYDKLQDWSRAGSCCYFLSNVQHCCGHHENRRKHAAAWERYFRMSDPISFPEVEP